MLVYFIIFFLISIGFVIKQPYKKGHLIIITIILILLAAFRSENVGHDYMVYAENFKNYEYLNFFSLEPSFYIISYLIHEFLSGNIFYLFFIYAIISTTILYFAIIKNSKFLVISFLLYYSNYFILHEMIQIRTAVACNLFLLGLYFLYNKNIYKYILLATFATFFHYSAMIMFLVPLINKNNLNKNIYYGLLIIPIILIFFNYDIIEILSKIPIPIIAFKVETYKDLMRMSIFDTINVFNYQQIFRLIVSMLLVFYSNNFVKHDEKANLFIKIYVISVSSFFLLSPIPVFAFRISEFLGIVEPVVLTYFIYLIKPKFVPKVILVLISLGFLLFNIYYNNFINEYSISI